MASRGGLLLVVLCGGPFLDVYAHMVGGPSHDESFPMPRENGGSSVYQSISSKIGALEARLTEAELENKQIVDKQEQHFQEDLKRQQAGNAAMALTNQAIEADISKLNMKTSDLRKQADVLEEENERYVNDLNALKANMTTALEFTENSLKDLVTPGAKELAVLDELAKEDAIRDAHQSHRYRLDEVATNGRVALLQMSKPVSPEQLVKMLDAGFQDLAQEHTQRKAELKDKYKALFQLELDRHRDLLAQQRELNSTKQSLDKLAERLEAAVLYLQDRRNGLEKRSRAIRMYAQRLGIRQLPGQRSTKENKGNHVAAAVESNVEDMAHTFRQSLHSSEPRHVSRSLLEESSRSLLEERPTQPGDQDVSVSARTGRGRKSLFSWIRRW